MNQLNHPDAFHAQAAQGWLELGDSASALEELEQVAPDSRSHPLVLMVEWHIHAKMKKWEICVQLGRALTVAAPDSPFGWINLCNSLYFNGETQLAFDTLRPLLPNFPDNELMPYNLACYACQLGTLAEAKTWLKRAFRIGDSKELKRKAGQDPDLQPLWEEIRTMA